MIIIIDPGMVLIPNGRIMKSILSMNKTENKQRDD
jgi:hypothetical protein